MSGGESVGAFLDRVAIGAVHVADGNNVVRRGFGGGVEQAAHAVTGTDDADAQSIVGAEHAGGSQGGHAGGDDEAAASNHGPVLRRIVRMMVSRFREQRRRIAESVNDPSAGGVFYLRSARLVVTFAFCSTPVFRRLA